MIAQEHDTLDSNDRKYGSKYKRIIRNCDKMPSKAEVIRHYRNIKKLILEDIDLIIGIANLTLPILCFTILKTTFS